MLNKKEDNLFNSITNYIIDNINDPKLNVSNIANEYLISRSHLYRKIITCTGESANKYIMNIRLAKAKNLLKNTELTISEISYKVGFSSPSYFTKCFSKKYKILPKKIKNPQLSKDVFFNKVFSHLEKKLSYNNFGVNELSKSMLISRSKLYRKVKKMTNYTASEFIRKIKLEKAKEMLVTTELTVSEISYKVGFSSPSYFTKCFKNYYGMIPKELRTSKTT